MLREQLSNEDDEAGLVQAAFELAAQRLFRPRRVDDVPTYVGNVQARFGEENIDRVDAETMLRSALHEPETSTHHVAYKARYQTGGLLFVDMCQLMRLTAKQLDQLLREAERAAAEVGWHPKTG